MTIELLNLNFNYSLVSISHALVGLNFQGKGLES